MNDTQKIDQINERCATQCAHFGQLALCAVCPTEQHRNFLAYSEQRCMKDRLGAIDRLKRLEKKCHGCTLPPADLNRDLKFAWCRGNCWVMEELQGVGDALDSMEADSRQDRGVKPIRRQKKRPDAVTSDLVPALV